MCASVTSAPLRVSTFRIRHFLPQIQISKLRSAPQRSSAASTRQSHVVSLRFLPQTGQIPLQASLQTRDSAVVRVALAKIYLDQKKPDLARQEVEKALKLAPNYAEAKQLLEHLQNSKSSDKPAGGAP